MEVLGLAYISLGLLAGASFGWALARTKNATASNSVEEELIRTKALLEETSKSEERVREQMLDGFKLAAGEAFSLAVETAEKQKESSFKKATDDLTKSIGGYISAIQEAKEKDIQRSAKLGEKVDNLSLIHI